MCNTLNFENFPVTGFCTHIVKLYLGKLLQYITSVKNLNLRQENVVFSMLSINVLQSLRAEKIFLSPVTVRWRWRKEGNTLAHWRATEDVTPAQWE
jgi:hypothetical protein